MSSPLRLLKSRRISSVLLYLPVPLALVSWILALTRNLGYAPPAQALSVFTLIISLLALAFIKSKQTAFAPLLSIWLSLATSAVVYLRPRILLLDMPERILNQSMLFVELFPVLLLVAIILRFPGLLSVPSLSPAHTNGDSLMLFRDKKTGRKVAIPPLDRYLNTIIVGPIGSGKSSRMLAPIIWQELCAIKESIKRGVPRGITVLEPKGDLTDKAAEMCKSLGLPYVYINPLESDTGKFNPLEGEPMLVAEATRTVLRSVSGRQEAFFALSQEIAARNTILLLKYMRGNQVSLPDVSQALRDPDSLKKEINGLKSAIMGINAETRRLQEKMLLEGAESNIGRTCHLLIERNHATVSVRKNVIEYFENEVFGTLKEKTYQFVTGLRLQFDDLIGNESLFRVISPHIDPTDGSKDYSSDISLDQHLAQGGVLLVNTASNNLGRAGDAFGRYVLQHLQGAVFRRPGSEHTRPRHTTVIDELSLYVASDFERMLSNGRSYRNENIIALQSTSQLILDEKRAFRETIMNLCRNKVFFGGMDGEDAKYISRELGDESSVQRTYTFGSGVFSRFMGHEKMSESERDRSRFSPTALMELPPYHVAYKVVNGNRPRPPGIGIADLSPWDKAKNRHHKTGKRDKEPETLNAEALLSAYGPGIRQSLALDKSCGDPPTDHAEPTPVFIQGEKAGRRSVRKKPMDGQQPLPIVTKDIPDQQF